MNKPLPDIRSWWLRFVQWCGQAFGQRKPYPGPKILNQEASADGLTNLYLLERLTPGSLGTWRLKHKYCPSGSLILMIDNLAQIRRWLKLERRNAEALKNPYETTELERSLLYPGFELTTHRFGVQWLKHPGDGSTGIQLITVFDANFDSRRSIDPDRDAFQVVRLIAREIMNFKRTPGLLWQERVLAIHWEERLLQAFKGYFGADHPSHIFKRK